MNLVFWGIWLAAGLLLEGIGILDAHDQWPTLTDVIRKYVPKAMIATALAWLAIHFGVN